MKQVRSSRPGGKPPQSLKCCSEFPLYEFNILIKKVYRKKQIIKDQPKAVYGSNEKVYTLEKGDTRVKIKESQLWELVIKENPCVDF